MGKRGVLFRGKKGQIPHELLMEAMQTVAVVLILVGSLAYVQNELSKIGFAKKFYARDTALFITALHSAPGNVAYLQDISTIETEDPNQYLFQFSIYDQFVRVNATNSKKQNIYWYFSSPKIEPVSFDESGLRGTIMIAKKGNRIEIGRNLQMNAHVMACQIADTSDPAWRQRKLVLDPSHFESEGDTGGVNSADSSFTESYLSYAIARRINVPEQNKIITREENVYKSMERRAEAVRSAESSAPIISIHTGDSQNAAENYIRAYYNIDSGKETRMKSSKLGCSILNAILQKSNLEHKEDITGLVVMPSDSAYIKSIIPAGRIGVMLELGNIQIPRNENFLADTSNLADAIFNGLEAYYTR